MARSSVRTRSNHGAAGAMLALACAACPGERPVRAPRGEVLACPRGAEPVETSQDTGRTVACTGADGTMHGPAIEYTVGTRVEGRYDDGAPRRDVAPGRRKDRS